MRLHVLCLGLVMALAAILPACGADEIPSDEPGGAGDPCHGDPRCRAITTATESTAPTVDETTAVGIASTASTALACTVGSNYCDKVYGCMACCNGTYQWINTCQYGVYYYCNGAGPYYATNCWPVSTPAE